MRTGELLTGRQGDIRTGMHGMGGKPRRSCAVRSLFVIPSGVPFACHSERSRGISRTCVPCTPTSPERCFGFAQHDTPSAAHPLLAIPSEVQRTPTCHSERSPFCLSFRAKPLLLVIPSGAEESLGHAPRVHQRPLRDVSATLNMTHPAQRTLACHSERSAAHPCLPFRAKRSAPLLVIPSGAPFACHSERSRGISRACAPCTPTFP